MSKIKPIYSVLIGIIIVISVAILSIYILLGHTVQSKTTKWAQTTSVDKKINNEINNAKSQKSTQVVLVFYKDECPYCEVAMPDIQKTAKKHNDVKTYYVNFESEQGKKLAAEFDVKKVPTLVSFKTRMGIPLNNNYLITSNPELVTTGTVEKNNIKTNQLLIDKIYSDVVE